MKTISTRCCIAGGGPAGMMLGLLLVIQDRVIKPVLGETGSLNAPWPLRLLVRFSFLRRIPARLIGVGFRPEHVRTPVVSQP